MDVPPNDGISTPVEERRMEEEIIQVREGALARSSALPAHTRMAENTEISRVGKHVGFLWSTRRAKKKPNEVALASPAPLFLPFWAQFGSGRSDGRSLPGLASADGAGASDGRGRRKVWVPFPGAPPPADGYEVHALLGGRGAFGREDEPQATVPLIRCRKERRLLASRRAGEGSRRTGQERGGNADRGRVDCHWMTIR